jgi:putative ABC transport system permease protein
MAGLWSAHTDAKSRGIVFRLSRADLANEWILTLCLVMAVTAVLSPLLIILGLKYGTIQTLRHRLVQDPRNREIRPMESKSFAREWFDQVRGRPDVAFIVPMTRQISASIDATVSNADATGRAERIQLDVIPTVDGDPLILENGAKVPALGECVLTHLAAEALGVRVGSTLAASVKRYRDGRVESGALALQVSGVLNLRAGAIKGAFVRLAVLDAVEHYKDGLGVPEYGWEGSTATAYPQYDGLIVIPARELTNLEEFQLVNGTGFTQIRRISSDDISEQFGFQLTTDRVVYWVATTQKNVGQESVDAIRGRLRGLDSLLIPAVKDLRGELLDASGSKLATLRLRSLSAPKEEAHALRLNPFPEWRGGGAAPTNNLQIMLPQGMEHIQKGLKLRVTRGEESLTFPVDMIPQKAPGDNAFIPLQLAGILNLFKERNITFDPNLQLFVLSRRGYAGFRLYTATIDDVDQLRRDFEAAGVPVFTEAERIYDVTQLDKYLTLIFWLIALVGVTGGVAALMASLYASVQRKQKEISVLRLLGFSGGMLFRFPVYQGVLISMGGFLVALAFFEALALVINTLFQSHLRAGESFCRLSAGHLAISFAGTIAIAILASSAAAWQTTRIDPAEALRDE